MRILSILTVLLLKISLVVSAQSAQIDSLKQWTLSANADITKAKQLLKQIRSGNNTQFYTALELVYDSVKLKQPARAAIHSGKGAAYEIEATLEWLDMEKKGTSGKEARLQQIFSLIHQKKAAKKVFNAELILLQDYTDHSLPLLISDLDKSSDEMVRALILRALSISNDPSLEQKMLDRIDRKNYQAVYPAMLGLLNSKGGAATIQYLDKKLAGKALQRTDAPNLEQIVKERIIWRMDHPLPAGKR